MSAMKPQLVDVETFVVVARELSISAASRELDISKSVISRRLKRLEAQLKVQLLHRTTRKVSLTEEGSLYYQDLGGIRATLDRAHERLQLRRDQPTGLLRVILPSYLGSSVITQKVIPQFMAEHPGVSLEVRLTEDGPFSIPREFDLLVMTRLPDRPLPDSSLRERKLGRLSSGLFASTEYLAANGVPQDLADLADHRCISYHSRMWRFKRKGQPAKVLQVSGSLTTGSNEVLKAAVMAHRGITYSFAGLFEQELASGHVQPVLQDWTEEAGLDLRILTPGQSYPPMRVRYFADAIRAQLGIGSGR